MNQRIFPDLKSILQHIKELERTDWDYYSEIGISNLSNPFIENESHREFIKNYFKISGKEWIFKEGLIQIDLIQRCSHINSVFFIGLLVFKNTRLKKSLFTGTNSAGYHIFPFLWFMTSLFHDAAMQIENNLEVLKDVKTINELKKKYNIVRNLLNQKIDGNSKKLFNSCKRYYEYRISQNKIDHGIFGGIYLFDRLVKIRRIKYKEGNSTLYWGKELEIQYARIACAIATHNIYVGSYISEEDAKEFNLKTLKKFKPFSILEDPLLYLLGIVDSMDPIKAYTSINNQEQIAECNVNYILENIFLEFTNDSISFTVSENSSLNFNILKEKLNCFNEWISVKIEVRKPKITLNFQ